MPFVSGIKNLDAALGGGFAEGSLCSVVGHPGSGLGVLAMQFASAGEEKSYYFSTMDSSEEVLSTIKRFGWNKEITIVDIGDKYYDSVLLKKLKVTRYRQEGIKVNDVFDSEPEGERPFNFLTYLTHEIFKITPPFRITIDSLDFFLDNYGVEEVLSALRTLKAYNKRCRGVMLATMTKDLFDSKTQNAIDALCDTLIELERERVGKKFENNFIVSKVKSYPERTKILQYTVTSEGFTLFE
ncbi:MAG: RAD55 family ATPase [Thermoplasmata archaeon]|uniref:RAD55 family ATPase n=1 Tax=Candidatus Sysuiplasma superficiale TaxID=2823368 RepID=A0A8J7YHP0_9ARCH|nr:recombinase RecA [Candidatus Sysuiplasma superficiale]MBX8643192.1 RAD55 family ATPase [Candidatus Sysuiplasma superficiale]MCL4346723.1 RAD55 family ATPase [Candidatus Thermoplasmatota archaeon]